MMCCLLTNFAPLGHATAILARHEHGDSASRSASKPPVRQNYFLQYGDKFYIFGVVFFVLSQNHNLIRRLLKNYARQLTSPRHGPKWTHCDDLRWVIGAGCQACAVGNIGRLYAVANGPYATRRFSADRPFLRNGQARRYRIADNALSPNISQHCIDLV